MRRFPGLFAACVMVCLASTAGAVDPTYWDDIRPLLRKHCTACHSRKTVQEVEVSGGLALDSVEAIVQAKKAIVASGKSSASSLYQSLIAKDESQRMPRASKPLEAAKIELIRRWIDAGMPEGKKPIEAAQAPAPSASRSRKLDVKLATNATPPAGVFGKLKPSKLELALQVGPLAPVTAVAFGPDHKLLATGAYGRVTIWDLAGVRPIKVLTNVLGAVNDIRFSPAGMPGLLAVAGGQPSAKGDLRLYQTSDWKLLGTLGGHEDVVFGICFSPDGKQLASASFDKTVRLWNVADRKPVHVFTGHSDFVYAVAFSPDGKQYATASKDRSVKLVDAATGRSLRTYSGLEQDILAVAFHPDGKSAVSSGFESHLYWWDTQTGQRIKAWAEHGVATHEITFSKDGKLLLTCGANGNAKIWNDKGSVINTLNVGTAVYAVAWRGDNKLIATGSYDGLTRLWDAAKGQLLITLLSLPPQGEHFDWLAVSPQGYVAGTPGLAHLGQWKMADQPVAFDAAWKKLQQPDTLARALRGENLPAPSWK